jgi:hypothetical protein
MSATVEATLYTTGSETTEQQLAEDIKGELEDQHDAGPAVKQFKVTITVEEVRPCRGK